MKILIICVNYNSNESLYKYIESINQACHKNCEIVVNIVDNSPVSNITFSSNYPNINEIKIIKNINNGYFGGVAKSYNEVVKSLYDYVIISNVDLRVEKNFFEKLKMIKTHKGIGWIAPSIISMEQNRDINPKIIERPSLMKIRALILLYQHPILYNFYLKTFFKRKKIEKKTNKSEIYAGHGSFIILTKEFTKKIQNIEYPIFLFGEEQYLGELCKNNNLKVIYYPKLIVYDNEHESTGKLKDKIYCEYNKKAQIYILNNYYE